MANKHEREVLKQIGEHGGFSVFWATEFQQRARAIERLQKAGTIKRIARGQFPWCPYRLTTNVATS